MNDTPERRWTETLLDTVRHGAAATAFQINFQLDEQAVVELLSAHRDLQAEKRINQAFAEWLDIHVQSGTPPAFVQTYVANGWPVEPGIWTDFCRI